MDIFSTTSKQVASAVTTPKAEAPAEIRKVETVQEIEKPEKENPKDFEAEKIKKINATVKNLNENMEALDTNVKFGFNEKISLMYVSVIEKSSGKMIRKFPSDEVMLLSERMKEIIGTIFDKKG